MTIEEIYIPEKIVPVSYYVPLMNKQDILGIITTIKDKEYELCDRYSGNMWANSKPGHWGKGMINTPKDRRKAERIGRLGEMAFAKLFGASIDLSYRKNGDNKDCTYKDKRIDIKTSSTYPRYNAGLIRAVTEHGKKLRLKCNIYVFGYLKEENREKKSATIVLVGYEEKEQIEKLELKPAILGKHLNYQIPYLHLKNIYNLFNI